MKTKPKRYQSCRYRNDAQNIKTHNVVNPRERLMNTQKRQKLRDLLIDRFSHKYNIGNNTYLIEDEITKFLQQEKLNDVDLQRLDARIKRIISQNISQKNLKESLTKNLNYNQQSENEQNQLNLEHEESIYPTNYQPPIESTINQSQLKNANLNKSNKSNLRSASYKNARPLSSQTYIRNDKINLAKDKSKYKSPEEELAALEAELKAEEERDLREKGYYHELNNDLNLQNLDFSKYGNEWAAMAAYDKKIYEQQILDEKIRNNQLKKRTKYELDEQVKEKIKKEYEDELKEKEYDKLFKEHQKELDKIEKEKEELIRQQYLREKESREAQLKDNYIRKRIDELKDKKFDIKTIKNIKKEIENERKQVAEEKRKRNAELNKALEENERNKKNQKILQDKQKEEDLQFLDEQRKMDLRLEQQREYLLNSIRNKSERYTNKQAEEKIQKIKKDQEEEEKKMIFYMNEKARIADEKEMKEKLRRQAEKKELKKYYDMQVEEKNKDSEFEKLLDGEQARIWKKDCDKYNEDEKRIAKIIRAKNVRNLDTIKEQIKIKKEKEKNKNKMSAIEFAMNRNKLIKVQQALDS
jgi:hypothetical protein